MSYINARRSICVFSSNNVQSVRITLIFIRLSDVRLAGSKVDVWNRYDCRLLLGRDFFLIKISNKRSHSFFKQNFQNTRRIMFNHLNWLFSLDLFLWFFNQKSFCSSLCAILAASTSKCMNIGAISSIFSLFYSFSRGNYTFYFRLVDANT